MSGGTGLSGAHAHRPRCGRISSSLVSLGHRWALCVPKTWRRRRKSKPRFSAPGNCRTQQTQQVRWTLEHARSKLKRFEEALEAMGDMQVEFLQDALKRARQAAQERSLASQMSEYRRFIERSERRLEDRCGTRGRGGSARGSTQSLDTSRGPNRGVACEVEDLSLQVERRSETTLLVSQETEARPGHGGRQARRAGVGPGSPGRGWLLKVPRLLQVIWQLCENLPREETTQATQATTQVEPRSDPQ